MTNIERGFERMKLGVWDDGTIAGVYTQGAQIGERPDLTVVEYVRADHHRGAVSLLREAHGWVDAAGEDLCRPEAEELAARIAVFLGGK